MIIVVVITGCGGKMAATKSTKYWFCYEIDSVFLQDRGFCELLLIGLWLGEQDHTPSHPGRKLLHGHNGCQSQSHVKMYIKKKMKMCHGTAWACSLWLQEPTRLKNRSFNQFNFISLYQNCQCSSAQNPSLGCVP